MKMPTYQVRFSYALFAAITALAVFVMLAGRTWWKPAVMPATTVASLSFLAAAQAAGALGTRYGRLVLVGLAFCALGDLVGPQDFYLGMYAFLIAHFVFVPAFLIRARTAPAGGRQVAGALLVTAVVTVALAVFWLGPYLPAEHRLSVLIYVGVLAAMVVVALAVRLDEPGPRLAAGGAVLFYISDIFIANWKYVITESWNAYLAYPLYYTACLLLAASVTEGRRRASGNRRAGGAS